MIKQLQKKLVTTLALGLLGGALMQPAVAADEKAEIKKRLTQMIAGDANQAEITKIGIPGLYQIQVGMTVVYMSADGKYLMNGNVIELDTNTNLTRQAQAKARKAAMALIPEESMIVYPAKNEKHEITIFTDIDCPYCKKLHKEIPALNEAGVTVRYLAYPRAGLGSPSYFKAVSVWCADDKAKMMDDVMLGMPAEKKQCENPVRDHMIQAQVFEVNGTPNIIFDNGDLLPGYAPAKEILKLLKKS